MLFQYYPYYGSSGIFQSLTQTLLNWGLMDAILPFILIFTILYMIIHQIQFFSTKKGVAILLALTISAMVLIPHVLHLYPPDQDPFIIMSSVLPSLTIILLGIFMLMILLGFTGLSSSWVLTAVGYVSVAALIYIILASIFPSWQVGGLYYFFTDPSVLAFIIIVAVMGLVILFVTLDSPEQGIGKLQSLINAFRGLAGPSGGSSGGGSAPKK